VYLAVGVSQTTELPQWQEASLYKFDARFHDSLIVSQQLPVMTTIARL